MVSFARSIIDRREPQGIRGKAIVRNRLLMTRTRPFGTPGNPGRERAVSSINGTRCCCGDPPCADTCVTTECEYCVGRDVLSLFETTIRFSQWWPSAGGPTIPPCNNNLNACPGKPSPCAALDVTASYDGLTKIEITDFSLATPTPVYRSQGCVFGSIDGGTLIGRRFRRSGQRGSRSQGCAIITAPTDQSEDVPFELRRCNGGFLFDTNGGGQQSTLCNEDCTGNQCTSRDCTAAGVLHDLLCALLPHDCTNVDVAVDTGCVQNKSSNQLSCLWEQFIFNQQIGIVRN